MFEFVETVYEREEPAHKDALFVPNIKIRGGAWLGCFFVPWWVEFSPIVTVCNDEILWADASCPFVIDKVGKIEVETPPFVSRDGINHAGVELESTAPFLQSIGAAGYEVSKVGFEFRAYLVLRQRSDLFGRHHEFAGLFY